MKKHGNASRILLALGGILLGAVVDLCSQPPVRGMMWTSDDDAQPVKMTSDLPCSGFILADNILTYTDHGVLEGYFEVGEGFAGIMKPKSPYFDTVKINRNKAVQIVLRLKEPPQRIKIERDK